MTIYQVAPNRWSTRNPQPVRAQSTLPMPYVISDTMEPTEQVDGKYYSSKRAFRAVGKALGLTEVGSEKPKPRQRTNAGNRENKLQRHRQLEIAAAQYKQGRRAQRG